MSDMDCEKKLLNFILIELISEFTNKLIYSSILVVKNCTF